MAIEGDEQLGEAAAKAGELLQEIQNYLGSKKNDLGKVRFPRGYIGAAATYRSRLPEVESVALAKNISYAFMMLDVLRWVAVRTDLSGQAMEMVVKEAVCLIGSICETLTIRRGTPGLGKSKSYVDRTARLVELNVISAQLKVDLDWVWEVRCREHLLGVQFAEWNHYTRSDHNRARSALDTLIVGLREYFDVQV